MFSFAPPTNFSSIISSPSNPPVLLVKQKPDLIPGLPDGLLAIASPVVAYWLYSSLFHFIDIYELAEKYRIHPSEEEEKRNKVSLTEVIRDVIIQHCIQTILGLALYKIEPAPVTGHELYLMWSLKHNYLPSFIPDSLIWFTYNYGFSMLKLVIGFTLIDTWQYFLHRAMHVNKNLYKRFHSRHHHLYVPYAYGALYNHPFEGFLLDTVGTGLAAIVLQVTPREATAMYTIATMKTVDDHSGYRLPFDPFQMVFPNNALLHDIHHQNWGFTSNYSQPFFTFWDKWLKTENQFVKDYDAKQREITLKRYKEYLAKRAERKAARAKGLKPVESPEDTKKTI